MAVRMAGLLGGVFVAWLCAASCQAEGLTVIAAIEEGVSGQAAVDVERAAQGVNWTMQQVYAWEAERKVTMCLTLNRLEYQKALQRHFAMPASEAFYLSQRTAGWTAGHFVLTNVEGLSSATVRQRHFMHELTHQYVYSLVDETLAAELLWLSEGLAEVVAFQASGIDGPEVWKQMLRLAPTLPYLSQLRRPGLWRRTVDVYGTPVCYAMSALAVWRLEEAAGAEAVRNYYQQLRVNPDKVAVFANATGRGLVDFEDDFERWLAAESLRRSK